MPELTVPSKTATQFTEAELRVFIETLMSSRTGDGTQGRFAELHKLIRIRDNHFYARLAADQKLPAPHDDVEPYQSDLLRKTHTQIKARMMENPYIFRVEPPREGLSRTANNFETVLQRGFELAEEREDISLQGDMADGQVIHGAGILHWQRAPYPTFPIADESDAPGDGYADRTDEDAPGLGKPYVETAASRLERDKVAKAQAGFPYYFEVLRFDQCAFIADRSLANGFGAFLGIRTTSLVEYNAKLRERDGKAVGITSINQYAKRIRIYEEKDHPANSDPSANPKAWGSEIAIAQFWTRDEGYELVSMAAGGASDGSWTLVKSWTHAFGMPPFALARAFYTNHPDPALAYQPALEGGYRIKPFVDRAMTAHMAIANQIALPFYYLRSKDGSYLLGPSGTPMMLTRDSLAAQDIGDREIVTIAPTMDASLVESLKMLTEQLADALPESGFVEIGASTQPWAIRLGQDQANTIVSMLKREQAKALQQCARSIANDMIDLGEPVYVYGKTKAGAVDTTTVIGIDPKDIPTLDIQVDIDPRSSAQAISNIEHLRALLDDPLVPYTPKQFLAEAMHSSNPDADLEEWQAWEIWNTRIRPVSTEQELARRFGDKFVTTPDMGLVGANGLAATPADAIKAAGYGVAPDTSTPPGGSPVPKMVQQESQPQIPPIAPLMAPGTQPVYGGQ